MTSAAATKSRASINPARSRGGMGPKWIHSIISLALLMALAYCPQPVLSADIKMGADGKPCVDLHEHCTYWAGTGECENSKGYMGENCRLACDRCHIIRVGDASEMNAFIESKKAELEAASKKSKAKSVLEGKSEL